MQAAISKAKRTDKKEKSSQDSIPYLLMRQDGICQVTRNHYTKTIQFRDINYQLSDNEDKQAIFDSWCDFLNYFDSSVSFQLSFINLTGLRGAALRTIPVRTDQFESIQRELSEVIRNQQEKGNNGIVKTKYLTFGIDADSVRSAKPRLERIETDILNNFKKLGVSAQVLTGKEIWPVKKPLREPSVTITEGTVWMEKQQSQRLCVPLERSEPCTSLPTPSGKRTGMDGFLPAIRIGRNQSPFRRIQMSGAKTGMSILS